MPRNKATRVEFRYDQSLRRHAVRITGAAGSLKHLADVHGVLAVVEDHDGCTAYLKPGCCREAAMQAIEKTLGVTR